MSNVFALFVGSSADTKGFCTSNDALHLRSLRAELGMGVENKVRSIEMEGWAIVITELYPVMLRTLVSFLEEEPYERFPYPSKTYEQELTVASLVEQDVPCIFGNDSAGPWLWEVPAQIIRHLNGPSNPQADAQIAKSWLKTIGNDLPPISIENIAGLLRDLRTASIVASKRNERVFLYCST